MTPADETLWITDAELIRRIGVPEKTAREMLRELDRKASGFPRKQEQWGKRRYWPAVKAYFDALYGVKVADQQPPRRERCIPLLKGGYSQRITEREWDKLHGSTRLPKGTADG